jgi:hypothetical protein
LTIPELDPELLAEPEEEEDVEPVPDDEDELPEDETDPPELLPELAAPELVPASVAPDEPPSGERSLVSPPFPLLHAPAMTARPRKQTGGRLPCRAAERAMLCSMLILSTPNPAAPVHGPCPGDLRKRGVAMKTRRQWLVDTVTMLACGVISWRWSSDGAGDTQIAAPAASPTPSPSGISVVPWIETP